MDGSAPPPASPPPNSSGSPSPRSLGGLDADSLSHCAGFLGVRDLASMAMSSKFLRQAAYSDSVWRRLYQDSWPQQYLTPGASALREEYVARRTALLQLKFHDPHRSFLSAYQIPHSHILLSKNDVFVAQGAIAQKITINSHDAESRADFQTLLGHNASITSLRLFPLMDTSLFRRESQKEENVLVTSSRDHTIRLWWKGRSQRCFKGHNGPVTTLADKLLGESGSKVLASGGEDCTVRLWSISSSGKSHPLAMTYHAHEKPLSFLSAARHRNSLLVSISKDSKVRVWDTTASTSTSSSCVGMACVSGPPVGMKCHDKLCYIASGSSVTAIDLRTMQKALTVAVHLPRIYSFEMLPAKWLICTGGEDKAMLWDIRKSQEKAKSIVDMDAQNGRITMLHMDSYKVATGGPSASYVNIWETDTGTLANSLDCRIPGEYVNTRLSAMGIDGCRVVTSGGASEQGVLCFQDYSNCTARILSQEMEPASKFWEPQLL